MKKFSLSLLCIALCIVGSAVIMTGCVTTPCGCDESDAGPIKYGQKTTAGEMQVEKSAGWSR